MQEGNKKEKWDKPELIILIRGKPEESVMTNCKGTYAAGIQGTWMSPCNATPNGRTYCQYSSGGSS